MAWQDPYGKSGYCVECGLHLVPASGGPSRKVTGGWEQLSVFYPVWSPDGARILFAGSRPAGRLVGRRSRRRSSFSAQLGDSRELWQVPVSRDGRVAGDSEPLTTARDVLHLHEPRRSLGRLFPPELKVSVARDRLVLALEELT